MSDAGLDNNSLRTAMLTFDQFDHLFADELMKIPEQFKTGVAQFILEQREHRYSKYMQGLYTLGHYLPHGHFGNPVVILYFGSFVRAFPHHKLPELRLEIARTLTHELLHHWELSSGIDDLGDEDRRQLAEWKIATSYRHGESAIGKNYIEAMLFVYLVFVFVGVLARWLGL